MWVGNRIGALPAALSYGELAGKHPDLLDHLDEIWLAHRRGPSECVAVEP